MKRKIFTLFAVASLAVGLNAKELTLQKTTGVNFKIDGDASEYTGDWINISEEATASTTHDASAKFKIAYNDTALFLAIDVVDNTPQVDATQASSPWERDCAEVFIGLDSTGTLGYKATDKQLRMQRDNEEYDYVSLDNTFAYSKDGDAGYTIEWSINFKDLASTFEDATWDGLTARFDIQVIDNTAGPGRTQQLFWDNGTNNQWNNTSYWGKLNFATAPTMETAINKINNINKAYAYYDVKNQTLNLNRVKGMVSVYDVTGKLVVKSAKNNAISLATLKSGIYIVKADNLSTKIVK